MSIADQLFDRIRSNGDTARANDNIAAHLAPGDLERLQAGVEVAVKGLLHALVIDAANDHNSADTARRVAKMFCQEVFVGRYHPRPAVTAFPNVKRVDECYAVGPIAVRSACSHHMVPIMGQAWVGVIPGAQVIGLSKFHRLADWVMARPQIQEEAVAELADELESVCEPRALAVVVRAKHLCCGWRGVRDDPSLMTSSVMRGLFKEDDKARAEFLSLIAGMGY